MTVKLFAGAGCASIVFPAEMFPLEGFCGIHDDPHIRILLLECGERTAIVSAELVNLSGGLELVRTIVSEETGTDYKNVMVHVTHAITTPHIPIDPADVKPGMKIPPHMLVDHAGARRRKLYLCALEKAARLAAKQASESFSEARLGIGTAYSDININRDVETEFGWWIGLNKEGKSNKTVSLFSLADTDGHMIALLFAYGVKPCAIDNSGMADNSRLVSSDVTGSACSILEERIGAPCLFMMSASGDQVPREMALLDEVDGAGTVHTIDHGVEAGFEIVSRLGKELARDIYSSLENIRYVREVSAIKRTSFDLVCRTKKTMDLLPAKNWNAEYAGETVLTTDLIKIGESVFVATKPEINVHTEAELLRKSPFEQTVIFSMTNGGMKYMPEKAAYQHASWEAQSATLAEGTAEAWLDGVVKILNKMYAERDTESAGCQEHKAVPADADRCGAFGTSGSGWE